MTTIMRDPASYTDPSGYVYWEGDRVYRHIYPGRAAFFRTLLGAPVAAALQADGLLVPTRIEADGADGLRLAHEAISPRSYPAEWCGPMLQEAARCVLAMAERLAEADYSLADGHPWNVLMRRGRPVFIDVGSIAEAPERLLWPAQVQFNRYCLDPLHLMAAGRGEIARARLADLAQGLTPEMALQLAPAGYKLAHPRAWARWKAHATAERLTARADEARSASRPTQPAKAPDAALLRRIRQGYFRGLGRELDSIRFDRQQSDWARYYAQCPSMADGEAAEKARRVEAVLATLKPATVLDGGANTGQYALMAAGLGARVVALDQDEAAVAALYRRVQAEGADVVPLVMDLGNPTPPTGWCAEQRPDAWTRFASDAVLLLAVIHHLVYTGNHSFAQIARLVERTAKRAAIIEWVGPEDPMSRYLRRSATKDFSFYTLENLLAALEAAGFAVEVQAPHAADRQLLIATRSHG